MAHSLEHKILRTLKDLQKSGDLPSPLLVAVSGGADSVVLLDILHRWQRLLKIELVVGHVHHGIASSIKQTQFRNRAQKLVKKLAQERGLKWVTNRVQTQGKKSKTTRIQNQSEAALRELRQRHFAKWKSRYGCQSVVYAHHLDDLLETRLLRLLRGTGVEGLGSMVVVRGGKIRPLLGVTRDEILSYAQERKLKWFEDPSNRQGRESLRNWIRNDWLPSLERRQLGASKAIARSLALLASTSEGVEVPSQYVGLRRKEMKKTSSVQQSAMLASYIRGLGVKNYSQNHIQEVLKRLDTRQKHLTFQMLGVEFHLTPDFLWASRV